VAISFKRLTVYSTAILLALFALFAAYFWWSSRVSRFPDLAERVNAYYTSEKGGHWDEAYQNRVSVFQQSVPKQAYISRMAKDSQDWELKSFRVKYAERDGRRVKVFVEFVETTPKGYIPVSGLSGKGLTLTTTDVSVWENFNGLWYAWETGTRGHLSLNADLVAPN
jgi:hypothetical protein